MDRRSGRDLRGSCRGCLMRSSQPSASAHSPCPRMEFGGSFGIDQDRRRRKRIASHSPSSLLSFPPIKSPESERTCGLRRCEPGEQPRTGSALAVERGWSRGSQRGPASCTAPGRCRRRRTRGRSLSEPWATSMKRGSGRAACRASPLRDSSAPGITRCVMNAVLYFMMIDATDRIRC